MFSIRPLRQALQIFEVLVLLASFLSPRIGWTQESDPFIRGGDISTTPQIEDAGGVYRHNGVAQDLLDIVKANGMNYVRLRLWHTPPNGYCGLESTVAYAQRVKAKGLKLLLDFHYSDSWADPGKQLKPAAWASLPYDVLKDSVYTYTRDVLDALRGQGATPDMVQIGNEIISGMLWPDGRVGNVSNPTQAWLQFGELLKAGIRGARDGAMDSALSIMIHIDRGADNAGSRWFFDHVIAQGVEFDVIGLSYYPWWHGTFTQVKNNLNDLASRYNRPLVIVETAYPWTTQSVNDGVGNVGVNASALPAGYPISIAGQKAFLSMITKLLKETRNGKGAGFVYWEPAWISVPPVGSTWEHLTTFDFSSQTLSSITSFVNFDSIPTAKVTARYNTSTNPDTLKPGGLVQVRGEVRGLGSGLLPNGDLLTWDSYSQLVPRNAGGDYWEDTLRIYRTDTLLIKLWTGHSTSAPTYVRLGWEGPVIPFNDAALNGRLIVAGSSDTTLPVEYFNPSGIARRQDWSPFRTATDSVGVLFRVNIIDVMNRGQYDPATDGPLVVRGDSAASRGILSWTSDNLVLQLESLTIGGGSFWSGVAYFPRSEIPAGTQIPYKFYINNSSFDGTESAIGNRVFSFPQSDTTLAWRYFNERAIVTHVRQQSRQVSSQIQILQNYPNPFNSSTSIRYTLPDRATVNLRILNVLGQVVRDLVQEEQGTGTHAVVWDGIDVAGQFCPSGMYFIRLETEQVTLTRKIIFLR